MEGFYKFDGENWLYAPLHLLVGTIISLSCFLARLDYITIFIIVFAIAFFTEINHLFF